MEKEFKTMTDMLREKDEAYAKLMEKKQIMVDATFGLHDEVKELNAKIDDLKLNRLVLFLMMSFLKLKKDLAYS